MGVFGSPPDFAPPLSIVRWVVTRTSAEGYIVFAQWHEIGALPYLGSYKYLWRGRD